MNSVQHLTFYFTILALAIDRIECFTLIQSRHVSKTSRPLETLTALNAKRMKGRKQNKKNKSQQLIDAMADADGKKEDMGETKKEEEVLSPEEEERQKREQRRIEAEKRMQTRPDVSQVIVDEETGTEILQQGKNVMDVVSRKAVKLSDMGPEYRLAQMFPGVPSDIREKHRFNWDTIEVPQMVKLLMDASCVKLEDGTVGIPPHPSVSSKALDFVLANRDYLSFKMIKTLGRLTMKAYSLGNVDEGKEYKKLWRNFLTIENHISAPFRQMMMDGEGRVGPNFGNLDLPKYCGKEKYERCADYLVLKGMVAHWEKKVRDADYFEKTTWDREQGTFIKVLSRGDPKRYLPDPPILFSLKECTQVCVMAQKMCKLFVDTPELFDDLPPEIRFLEEALNIKGGTALRKFVVDDFCPREGITPEGLREGMRRLYTQLDNMQLDPYADITMIIQKLIIAMTVGSDDERDPYIPYLANLDPNGPGYFQTYTFNHGLNSIVRFLDAKYEQTSSEALAGLATDIAEDSAEGIQNLFSFEAPKMEVTRPAPEVDDFENKPYRVPSVRSLGRPHEMGWLELMDEEEVPEFSKIVPGRIIEE